MRRQLKNVAVPFFGFRLTCVGKKLNLLGLAELGQNDSGLSLRQGGYSIPDCHRLWHVAQLTVTASVGFASIHIKHHYKIIDGLIKALKLLHRDRWEQERGAHICKLSGGSGLGAAHRQGDEPSVSYFSTCQNIFKRALDSKVRTILIDPRPSR